MVDFNKHITKKKIEKFTNPLDIYESLDRASDKGDLREAQKAILNNWFANFKDKKDAIVKLHTGKGKTLIGLLMLQSKINSGEGPCLYLCPNKYLVEQTCLEAKSFGIDVCIAEKEIPVEFENSEKILVTTVKKLFNGKSRFGLDSDALNINTIILDDSHACLDDIKDTFTIKIPNNTNTYNSLISLFEEALKYQGQGSFEDIKTSSSNSYLPVSYWDWISNISEVVKILSKDANEKHIVFQWPLLKDKLDNCACLVSSDYIEISPYILPIETFSSFANAKNRIYMSATVNNDSFFIKHLNIDVEAIKNPITYEEELWSGEKMILIPSLIDGSLNNDLIMELFTKKLYEKRAPDFGVCILTPSFKSASPWKNNGATVAYGEDIANAIKSLKSNHFEAPIVFANRYDGIDLPDASCRILIFDGIPYSESLSDRYYENCLSDTELTNTKIAQRIEQGLGRNIRGERDFGTILILGKDLIRFIRAKKYQQYFSFQTQKQIEIGLEIVKFAKDDIEDETPLKVLMGLIRQLLKRDDGWKTYYSDEMNKIKENKENKLLSELIVQRDAEFLFSIGKVQQSITVLQEFLNNTKDNLSDIEYGWYLQQIARYQYQSSQSTSIHTQQVAHTKNNYLLKPKSGMVIKKLKSEDIIQPNKIKEYYSQFSDFNELLLYANETLDNLKFGIDSEKFEDAIKKIGLMLGFASERPDKQWKEGPDNLWAVAPSKYFVIECKNEVLESRNCISRTETGQMNNSCGWFGTQYQKCESTNIMIIPTLNIEKGGTFNYQVKIMRKLSLEKLKTNFTNFINEFSVNDFKTIPLEKILEFLKLHKLSFNDFNIYLENPKEIVIHKS